MLRKTFIAFVATVALGCVPATTSAFARGGGGGGHGGGFGGGMGGGHFGGGFGGAHIGGLGAGHLNGFGPSHAGGAFAGNRVAGHFGRDHVRRFGYGYYGCDNYFAANYPYNSCAYDSDTVF